eukprot:TRINITY_DN13829_c0_g1_i2.p1 TRINITY_DN13829_c0_g1~~TRINITY_DN13829_c0_g1_i2.p1  ORF type:complete len:210 (+),score=50.33 TRINITY_DN13829_c0_g1_i2:198-827(+)
MHVLDTGARVTQTLHPIRSVHAHLCAAHIYSGEPGRQIIAHHYCSHINDDVKQCLIYDSNTPTARLIGVEYIISKKLFESLPEEEKQFWHSHVYEIKSGMLTAPGIPAVAEYPLMEELVDTYGKTWHFWQVDRGDELPYGLPQLMMSFTRDGQATDDIMAQIDGQVTFGSIAKRRHEREGLPTPEVAAGADAWESGTATILRTENVRNR